MFLLSTEYLLSDRREALSHLTVFLAWLKKPLILFIGEWDFGIKSAFSATRIINS